MKAILLALLFVSCESGLERNQRLIEEVKICTEAGLGYGLYENMFSVTARCEKLNQHKEYPTGTMCLVPGADL
jgi:hypothetical protein